MPASPWWYDAVRSLLVQAGVAAAASGAGARSPAVARTKPAAMPSRRVVVFMS